MKAASVDLTVNNFTNSITDINVEFKYSNNLQKLYTYKYKITAGENKIYIPLAKMKSQALQEISEICFVVWNNQFIESEGMFELRNIALRI